MKKTLFVALKDGKVLGMRNVRVFNPKEIGQFVADESAKGATQFELTDKAGLKKLEEHGNLLTREQLFESWVKADIEDLPEEDENGDIVENDERLEEWAKKIPGAKKFEHDIGGVYGGVTETAFRITTSDAGDFIAIFDGANEGTNNLITPENLDDGWYLDDENEEVMKKVKKRLGKKA